MNMHNWKFFLLATLLLGFVSCSSDNDEDENGPAVKDEQNDTPSADKGKDNTKDLVVTGGIENISMDWDGAFTANINGYVNLSDSMKLLYGGLMKFGIEVSTDETFPSGMTYGYMGTPIYNTIKKEGKLKDDRQFTIPFENLYQNTKYYYRSFIQTGENIPIYGKTDSFTTKDVETMVQEQNMKAGIGTTVLSYERTYIDFSLGYSGNYINNGVVCAKDKSLLTSAKVKERISGEKNGLIIGFVDAGYVRAYISTYYYNGDEMILDSGEDYYYVEFKLVGSYPVLSEIATIKTGGYSKSELKKHIVCNAVPDYDNQVWKVTITSTLSDMGISQATMDVLASMTSTKKDIDTIVCNLCGQDNVYFDQRHSSYSSNVPFATPYNAYQNGSGIDLNDLGSFLEYWQKILTANASWYEENEFNGAFPEKVKEYSNQVSTYGLKHKFSTTLYVDNQEYSLHYITADVRIPSVNPFANK